MAPRAAAQAVCGATIGAWRPTDESRYRARPILSDSPSRKGELVISCLAVNGLHRTAPIVPHDRSGNPSQYVNAPGNEPELLEPFTDASTVPQISTVEVPRSSANPNPYSPMKSLAVLPLTPMSKWKSFDR